MLDPDCNADILLIYFPSIKYFLKTIIINNCQHHQPFHHRGQKQIAKKKNPTKKPPQSCLPPGQPH